MVEAFAALGAPVRFLHRQEALFGESVVSEALGRGDGGVLLLRLRRLRRLLLRLLLALQVDPLVPGQGRGVVEQLAAVGARVALPLRLRVDSLVARQGGGMVEALVAVVAHVGLVSLLVDPLLRGAAVGQRLPRLRLGVDGVLQVGLVMAGQRGGVVEALVAVPAAVGLPSGVDLLVLLQVALADEALPAHVALVGLVAGVDPLVLPEGGGGGEALPALRAQVGLVSQHHGGVGLLVLLQVGGGGEAFAALAAGVRLLARVHLLVLLQVPPADKALATLGALVGLVLRVHLHVLSQGDGGGEALTALGASVRFVGEVDHLVRLEAEGVDHILAHDVHSGDVGLLFHVDFHVLLQAGLHGKTLAAVDADVRVQILVDLKVLVKIRYAAKDLPALVTLQAVGFVDDHPVLGFHRQLATVVRLHLHHVFAFCLEQHLSEQRLTCCRLDFCSGKTLHVTVLHLNVVVVALRNNSIHAGHCSEITAESLDL